MWWILGESERRERRERGEREAQEQDLAASAGNSVSHSQPHL